MQFLNVQLPSSLNCYFTKNIVCNVSVAKMQNGKEFRQQVGKTKTLWKLIKSVKSKEIARVLENFFVLVNGNEFSFKMMDLTNNSAEFCICKVLSKNSVQLQRVSFIQEMALAKKITKPVEDSVKIYKNNSLMVAGYNVDYTTGVVNFEDEIQNEDEIMASFQFFHHVRFNENSIAFNYQRNVFEIDSVSIVEIID